jgi:hypothetical protein
VASPWSTSPWQPPRLGPATLRPRRNGVGACSDCNYATSQLKRLSVLDQELVADSLESISASSPSVPKVVQVAASNHVVGSLYASLTAAWANSTNSAISGARRVATHASRTSLGAMSVIGVQATSERW